MGEADGMELGAAVPHIFHKIMPTYNSKAEYVLWFYQVYLTLIM